MIPAARMVQADVAPELADQMALALRNVGNLDNEDDRFAAYYRANVDLLTVPFNEQRAADQVAYSIELARRMEGR